MAAKIFSIANQKGGVGKTTTAINLSAALAQKNVKTLLIDIDPQANATSGLGFPKEEGVSIYGALFGEAKLANLVQGTNRPNLSLIPAEVDLAAVEAELSKNSNYLLQLKKCIKPLKESNQFDVIIIDCPPALGILSLNALTAADYLLIALQSEYLAMEGLGQILNVVNQLKEAKVNPDLELGGILLTMFDKRTKLSFQVADEVREHFKKETFKTVIPRSTRLSEAPSFGKTIHEYDPKGKGAVSYSLLAREVIKRFDLDANPFTGMSIEQPEESNETESPTPVRKKETVKKEEPTPAPIVEPEAIAHTIKINNISLPS